MSPKAPDPNVRTALIETAARLLAEGGPEALTTRRLASEVGTSTMSVYTHFSGMDALNHAVREEGFARLAAFLGQVSPSKEDPVMEMMELGAAYLMNGLSNPHLYRFMFTEPPIDDDPDTGLGTFERLVEGVQRLIDSERLSYDATVLARQFWAMGHGVVTLNLAGLLTIEEAIECFKGMGGTLIVGLGVDRERTESAIRKTEERFGLVPTN